MENGEEKRKEEKNTFGCSVFTGHPVAPTPVTTGCPAVNKT